MAAHKTKGIDTLRWGATLPAALLGGLAADYVVLRVCNWIYGLDQQNWPDSIDAILPGSAMLAAVLVAAWVAPRARLTTASSLFLLFGGLFTLVNAVVFRASEAKVIFDAPLIAGYVGGALGCLLVGGMRAREQAA